MSSRRQDSAPATISAGGCTRFLAQHAADGAKSLAATPTSKHVCVCQLRRRGGCEMSEWGVVRVSRSSGCGRAYRSGGRLHWSANAARFLGLGALSCLHVGGHQVGDLPQLFGGAELHAVSYTHLTLPTILRV